MTFVSRFLCASLFLGLATALTGCGVGAAAPASVVSMAKIAGEVHGGAPPIVGAHVTLYETQAQQAGSNYGSAGKVLGTATTGGLGEFSFTTGYTCDAGEYVYVTATGGNPGGGTNNQSVQMAALGSCSNFADSTAQGNVRIYMSEVSTAAAAYALGNFMTVTDLGDGLQTVGVGAPVTNATAPAACTGTGVTLSCNANGLGHAFANAANLVDAVHYDGTQPLGLAYTAVPLNANSSVPQALLNLIGNIEQSCVNSSGGTGATVCGQFFTAATPPGGSAPLNTLSAVMNMAKYPTVNVTALTNLATPQASVFQPALAATTDFTVAIVYGAVTTLGYPYSLTLDINDNVYVPVQVASGTGPVKINAYSSIGTPTYTPSVASGTACQAGVPCSIASDTAGNLWLVDGSTTVGNLYRIVSSTGVVSGTSYTVASTPFFGVAVDKSNNVFVSVSKVGGTSVNALYELTSGGSALAAAGTNPNADLTAAIALNSAAGVWLADKYTATTTSVTNYFGATNSTTPLAANTLTEDSTLADAGLYGLSIDGSDNAWVNNATKLYKVASDNSAVTSTKTIQTSGGTVVSSVSARYSALDGAGNVFMPDNNGATASYIWQYNLAQDKFYNLAPCEVSGATPTCNVASVTTASVGPRIAQVDSTGSIWVASSTNGHLVQIIGTAAPTWPQLSYLKPGVKP